MGKPVGPAHLEVDRAELPGPPPDDGALESCHDIAAPPGAGQVEVELPRLERPLHGVKPMERLLGIRTFDACSPFG